MSQHRLQQLGIEVGESVRSAIRLIESYGGRLTHDSGHAKAPTWIYTFAEHGYAQLALRINREKLSIYVSATPHGRRDFEQQLPGWGEIEQVYPNPDGIKPFSSLLGETSAPFLAPKSGRRLIRIAIHEDKLAELLPEYLGHRIANGGHAVDAANDDQGSNRSGTGSMGRVVTPDMLRRSLDRNDATGRAGERLVYADEINRLTALGCPDPAACVHIVADTNVAAGYDIRVEWNGNVRCIEVKTSTLSESDFFLTINERRVLTALGEQAWLYRVCLDADGGGEVVLRLQDPMALLSEEEMQAVVWRVTLAEDREPLSPTLETA